jgi:hypothetical protein
LISERGDEETELESALPLVQEVTKLLQGKKRDDAMLISEDQDVEDLSTDAQGLSSHNLYGSRSIINLNTLEEEILKDMREEDLKDYYHHKNHQRSSFSGKTLKSAIIASGPQL